MKIKSVLAGALIAGMCVGTLFGCANKVSEETSANQEAVSNEETASNQEVVSNEETSANQEVSSGEETGAEKELIVFAAASLKETLTNLATAYEAENPSVKIVYNFDSSGTLKTQIEEGADCDVFISASQKQMNQLDINGPADVNTDSLDFVNSDTRFNILENKVVLAVGENSTCDINSFEELKNRLTDGAAGEFLLAIGNEDVPVGQYTRKIFNYFELNEEELSNKGLLSYGSNTKEVTTQVSEGLADCGVVYQTDAYSAGLKVADTATEEMCGRAIYPAAVLKNSKNQEEALKYLEFLKTDEADKEFERVGFTIVSE